MTSELDDALWKKILYIVLEEKRPFSFMDFVPAFTVDGKKYHITHQTFRNKTWLLSKQERIGVAYQTSQAFYTIKGTTFHKPTNDDPIGVAASAIPIPTELAFVKNDPLYRSIRNIPFGQKSLHNIRLGFKAETIWSAISSSAFMSECRLISRSKQIMLPRTPIDKLGFQVSIFRTGTVTIDIGCSQGPVAVDVSSVKRLSNALVAVQKKVSDLIIDAKVVLPNYMSWSVNMWHFGADALDVYYSGEKDHRRWKVAEKILLTIYSKEWKGEKKRFRWDLQEYPNKPLKEALKEKMNFHDSKVDE